MSLNAEAEALRQQLEDLARAEDDQLIERYTLRQSPIPAGLYWQLRWLVGWILRWLEATRILRPDPWPASVKQATTSAGAKPLLIWAVGADRGSLRESFRGFARMQEALPNFAFVVVTDVADFAFFSRLGWLVEYLPRVSGEGEQYEERKARFLARLYRDAPVLPLKAGLGSATSFAEALALIQPNK